MYACSIEPRLPCWYELATLKNGHGVTIAVSRAAYEVLSHYLASTANDLLRIAEQSKLPPFLPPSQRQWGFGPVLTRTGWPRLGWDAWRCMWPPGSKHRSDNWIPLYQVSATLSVLFEALLSVEHDGEAATAQLLECNIAATGGGLGHWGLYAGLSPALVRWLLQFPHNTKHDAISASMFAAWKRLAGPTSRQLDQYDRQQTFAATYRPGHIYFHCPGDACDLGPDHPDEKINPNRGFKVIPHNVDKPTQQLTFLTGLAALHQQAREQGV